MAKRTNTASLKGLLHEVDGLIIEEFGKKEEDPSEFFDVAKLLEEFKGKMVTISIKEESPLVTVESDEVEEDFEE